MLVGLVYLLRVAVSRAPLMLAAGSPVAGSVMAAIERQVSLAYVVRTARSDVLVAGAAVASGVVVVSTPAGRAVSADTKAIGVLRSFMVSPEMEGGWVYLMPVIAMPCMMCRCSTRKIATTGITTTTAPASSRPYFVAFWPTE